MAGTYTEVMSRVRAQSATEWAKACSTAFVPLRVLTTAARFTATLDRVELTQSVSVTRVSSEGSRIVRNARTIAEHPRDDLLLSVHRSGWGRVAQHDREAHLSKGSAALYDASAPYALTFPGRMSEIVLQVPRGVVTKTGHAFADLTAMQLPSSASMTALQNLLWAVDPRVAPRAGPLENEMLADAAKTLLQAALLPTASTATSRIDTRALALAMRTYIDYNLTDPDLSVEKLAHVHHVSVRFVYKIFTDHFDDGPGSYIRSSRLSLAYRQLGLGYTVLEAAIGCGFTDPDTFTRAFKRRYGYLPSTLKARGGRAQRGAGGNTAPV